MYCPTCGNEISVELKYCNRCGANLTLPATSAPVMLAPVKLAVPSIVLGITILGGLGVIFGAASDFARQGLHPAAIVWMVLFSAATLFGCVGLLIRFLTKMMTLGRELGYPVREEIIPREKLYLADEMFFCGTAVEVSPITSVDRITIGNGEMGPVTRAIQQQFFALVRGEQADRHRWLTPVPQPAATRSK